MAVAPTISVILPTQGRRDSLGAALASVLAQTGPTFEVVVVDDSPVGSAALVRRAGETALWHDERVRVVDWHRGEGCAAAKSVGLAAARGEWVCYLDDDNLMLPGRLERTLRRVQGTGAAMVLCGVELEVGGRRRRRQQVQTEFRGDDRLLGTLSDTNVLFHARSVGVDWDRDLSTTDDAVFFQRVILASGQAVVPNVPACLVVYRVHGGARANSERLAVYRGQRRLQHVVRPGYGREARRQLLRRSLLTNEKLRPGHWGAFLRRAIDLLRRHGRAEARLVANAWLVKCPLTRRWMVR